MLPRLINQLWLTSGLPARASFLRATQSAARTQTELLMQLVARHRHTNFGREHSFDRIKNVADFQRLVPPRSHEDFKPWIDAIRAGEPNVLTADPVIMLQPTSGTISGRKLIPFTAELASQFKRATRVWMCDLLMHHPRARSGTAYWSISPAVAGPKEHSIECDSRNAVPIGFASDLAYIGFWERQLAGRLMAVPADVGRITEIDSWRFWTLFHLLRARDLALISVWSPTFLIGLLEQLDRLAPQLLRALACDTRDPNTGRLYRGRPRLSEFVERLLQQHGSAFSAATQLWPQLALVSCWADASSARMAEVLQQQLPHVAQQPKGLMATEGCVTFPLSGIGNALAIQSHFFEFESLDGQKIHLAHQLSLGERYQVLLTTGGGLYRYSLHDIVEVTGFHQQCPLLRFVGRSNQTSDLVGEKLTERFVRSCLERAQQNLQLNDQTALLAPNHSQFIARLLDREPAFDRTDHFYYLVVGGPLNCGQRAELLRQVEAHLCENDYYRHAIVHGQLKPLAILHLETRDQLVTAYHDFHRTCGMRLGDIKLTSLQLN